MKTFEIVAEDSNKYVLQIDDVTGFYQIINKGNSSATSSPLGITDELLLTALRKIQSLQVENDKLKKELEKSDKQLDCDHFNYTYEDPEYSSIWDCYKEDGNRVCKQCGYSEPIPWEN